MTAPGLARPLVAEAIGTFALVFAGCGAVMVDAKTHQLGHVGVAISFGLVIMFGIYAVGHISGAHFNPAVTFAFALTRHFPWPRTVAYWGAQVAGALLAAALLRASLGNIADTGATLPSGSQGQSFLWELVLSAFLMFVILAVATDTRAVGEAAALAIGGTDPPRRDVRRPDLGGVDEPGPLARACARLREPARSLDLSPRAGPRSRARRPGLPVRARRAATRRRVALARLGHGSRPPHLLRLSRRGDRVVEEAQHRLDVERVAAGDAEREAVEEGGREPPELRAMRRRREASPRPAAA